MNKFSFFKITCFIREKGTENQFNTLFEFLVIPYVGL